MLCNKKFSIFICRYRQNTQDWDKPCSLYIELNLICGLIVTQFRVVELFPSIVSKSSQLPAYLRWHERVFQGQYLPSLNINYVANNKDLEKLPLLISVVDKDRNPRSREIWPWTNALCPLSKSQRLPKEGILNMARENAHFQQHWWGYFAFKRSLTCRLQNSRFFLKISKEIRKAWRKSLSFSLVPDILFDCQCVVEYPRIRTFLQSHWGVAMIELCLWSENLQFDGFSGRKPPDRPLFFCAALTSSYEGVTQ